LPVVTLLDILDSLDMKSKGNWWSTGVQFECTGSGKCCVSRDEYGYVYLTLKDRQRMAAYLKIPTRKFTRTYCTSEGGWFYLKDYTRACRFLEGKRCGVYEARPAQCRTWPFWPENMTPKKWTKEVQSFCPGVGKGKLYSAEEIKALLKQDPLND
jgi:Fe-S-cluster containining protein